MERGEFFSRDENRDPPACLKFGGVGEAGYSMPSKENSGVEAGLGNRKWTSSSLALHVWKGKENPKAFILVLILLISVSLLQGRDRRKSSQLKKQTLKRQGREREMPLHSLVYVNSTLCVHTFGSLSNIMEWGSRHQGHRGASWHNTVSLVRLYN